METTAPTSTNKAATAAVNGLCAGVAATIDRILSFGVTTRIELTAVRGASNDSPLQHFEVELPRQQSNGFQWAEGAKVRLVPSHLAVFEHSGQDWVI